MTAALAIINRAGSPLSSDVLRYTKIDAVCGGVPVERMFRLRSGCCLYYRTEGGDFCDVCVLLNDETQKAACAPMSSAPAASDRHCRASNACAAMV
ncbi:(2Fe-2S)-binding protein [Rhizobium sp. RCAM05350]|nr:(2Fe-2S)-binding protein [Rhizobium sp. RCAM05350]